VTCSRPGQVLRGDLTQAARLHAAIYGIWRKYGALPERFDWQARAGGAGGGCRRTRPRNQPGL
jgi:hypothetical protein